MMHKIKYICNKCGYEFSIVEQWSDLKPKKCVNKKCNASFRKNPELLTTKIVDKSKK